MIQVEPPWTDALYVEVPEAEARDRLWVQRKPGERNDEIWVNMGAGGLGDSLLALCALRGLRKLHPSRRIVFRIHRKWHDFIRLFDGGFDGCAAHVWDETRHDLPPDSDPRDWQINAGYLQELAGQAKITRLARYCRNLGVIEPELATLREPDRIKAMGARYAGAVVLCPYSAWPNREWPLLAWATVAELLRMGGYRVVVLGAKRQDDRPTYPFSGEVVMDTEAEAVTGILMNAALVIANDSGMAHLAGIVGTETVVLCGWSVGDRIYGFYPRVTSLQGMLKCNGCWGTPPFEEKLCWTCASLSTITPATLLTVIMPKIGVQKPCPQN